MLKLSIKEILPFELGIHHGVVGYALSFDNIHNPYYKKYESNAYKNGYKMAHDNLYRNIWKKSGNIRHILFHMIYLGSVKPTDFKLQKDNFSNHISIKDL